MKKRELIRNKPAYLGLSILELSKTLMRESWYDFGKPNYSEKTKLGYMNTDSVIVYIKTDDIYKDIAQKVETRSDISNYDLDRPLPKQKKLKSNSINGR